MHFNTILLVQNRYSEREKDLNWGREAAIESHCAIEATFH